MSNSPLVAGDFFCGGGGESTGFTQACMEAGRQAKVTGVNCWPQAINVYRANFPQARVICQRIESLHPREVFPDDEPEALLACPECTFHSKARGGRPINDQLRSSPWVVQRYLDVFRPKWFIIENVPEFLDWGPLNAKGRPIKALKGQTFKTYDQSLRSYGYNGKWFVLNSADYGAFTSRTRAFGVYRFGKNRPVFHPTPTHSRRGKVSGTRPWRAAREILDFTLPTRSIFEPPYLAANTLKRIAAGALKRWGVNIEPFLVHLTHGGREHDVGAPVPTVTGANRGELAVVEPFLATLRGTSTGQIEASSKSVDGPVPTLAAQGQHVGVVEPLVLGQHGGATARSANEPLPTIATGGALRVIEPIVLAPEGYFRGNQARGVGDPLPTIGAARGGEIRLVEPVVLSIDRPLTNRSLPTGASEPLATITGNQRLGLLEPFLVPNKGERPGQEPRHTGIDDPLNTVTATGNTGNVVQPLLIPYYKTGKAQDVDAPMPTQTTRDRFGLAIPVLLSDGSRAFLDIRFRMLHWRELAAAMGFPASYNFLPDQLTKTAIVKMIGNAVETNMAKALALSQIRGRPMDVPQVTLPGVAA